MADGFRSQRGRNHKLPATTYRLCISICVCSTENLHLNVGPVGPDIRDPRSTRPVAISRVVVMSYLRYLNVRVPRGNQDLNQGDRSRGANIWPGHLYDFEIMDHDNIVHDDEVDTGRKFTIVKMKDSRFPV